MAAPHLIQCHCSRYLYSPPGKFRTLGVAYDRGIERQPYRAGLSVWDRQRRAVGRTLAASASPAPGDGAATSAVETAANPTFSRESSSPASSAGTPSEAQISSVSDTVSEAASSSVVNASSAAESPPASASMPDERKKLWMAAIKPPMYSVGFIPVLVAGAAVFFELGTVPWLRCAGFVLAAILVIAWLNLSNDAFDASTGVDKTKAESVVNLTGGRWQAVLVLAKLLLVAGVGLLAYLITATGDTRVTAMLAFSILCGYVYQGPPFRLSYKGLGEPLCFFAFGPSATSAFYLALQPIAAAAPAAAAAGGAALSAAAAPAITPLVWSLSVLVGITTTVILFCSHFHQIAGDVAAGKMSPLVRLGTERARKVLRVAAITTYVIAAGCAAAGLLPLGVLATLVLSVPAAKEMVDFADANHTVPAKVAPLKRFAVKWHILFGLCLCLGMAVTRMVAGPVAV